MPGSLASEARLVRPDDIYEMLIEAHRDLDEEASRILNARLILLLANHVGDPDVLAGAIAAARKGLADE